MGIDYSKRAINYCNDTYTYLKNVNFIWADAQQLPIQDQSVDFVINVESSHIYKDVNKFFKEVFRVLKNDGKFLFTDFRYIKNIPINFLENAIIDSGFSIVNKKIITPQIYESCFHTSK